MNTHGGEEYNNVAEDATKTVAVKTTLGLLVSGTVEDEGREGGDEGSA